MYSETFPKRRYWCAAATPRLPVSDWVVLSMCAASPDLWSINIGIGPQPLTGQDAHSTGSFLRIARRVIRPDALTRYVMRALWSGYRYGKSDVGRIGPSRYRCCRQLDGGHRG